MRLVHRLHDRGGMFFGNERSQFFGIVVHVLSVQAFASSEHFVDAWIVGRKYFKRIGRSAFRANVHRECIVGHCKSADLAADPIVEVAIEGEPFRIDRETIELDLVCRSSPERTAAKTTSSLSARQFSLVESVSNASLHLLFKFTCRCVEPHSTFLVSDPFIWSSRQSHRSVPRHSPKPKIKQRHPSLGF